MNRRVSVYGCVSMDEYVYRCMRVSITIGLYVVSNRPFL